MPTLYSRLIKYQDENSKPPLPHNFRRLLGQQIIKEYMDLPKELRPTLGRKETVEPEGIFIAISYPETFIEDIDRIIKDFYLKLPNIIPKRKRIYTKSETKLAFSVKPSNRT